MAVTRAFDRGFGRFANGLALIGLPLALVGCAEHMAPGSASADSAQSASIRPSGPSPRPAALAVTQMEGAPTPLQTQFMALFNADVAQDDVTLTDSAAARYLARGYISAFPVDGGAKLTYVWDIYDRTNHRAQRLNDEIALKGASADPWSLVDGAALAALASRSARELAAYLSTTPEALAQAPQAVSEPQATSVPQAGSEPQAASGPAQPVENAPKALENSSPAESAAARPPQALSYADER